MGRQISGPSEDLLKSQGGFVTHSECHANRMVPQNRPLPSALGWSVSPGSQLGVPVTKQHAMVLTLPLYRLLPRRKQNKGPGASECEAWGQEADPFKSRVWEFHTQTHLFACLGTTSNPGADRLPGDAAL